MKIRILSANDVRRALPMGDAIEGMKSAFAQLSRQQAVVPLRAHLDVQPHQGTTLVMPAYLQESDDLAVKIVSIFPQNVKRQQPTISAMVLLLDAKSGRPLAIMEGASLTAVRTGAGSGAATDLLARKESAVVAILGSGVQARTQLEAVCTVRYIQEVRVYSPNHAHTVQFAREMKGRGRIPQFVRMMNSAETAVRGADIICTATSSNTPVFSYESLKSGVHINGVGSFLPTMQEIDEKTVRESLLVVDSRQAALEEAGDLIIPIQNGSINEGHIHAELGEIVAGLKPGRTNNEQITFFKSVGVAVQDAAAAQIALQNAEEMGLGTMVDF